MNIFYPESPRDDMHMTYADKCEAVKAFRRKYRLRNLCLLLGVIAAVLSGMFSYSLLSTPMLCGAILLLAAGVALSVLTNRCPFCGRYIRRRISGRWYFTDLFIPYQCPDCDFTTDWKRWL